MKHLSLSLTVLILVVLVGMAYGQERPEIERPTPDSFCSCWGITPEKPGDVERPHWLDMEYWADQNILDWWEEIPILNQAVLANIITRELTGMKSVPDYETWTVEEFFIAGPVRVRERLIEYLTAISR